MWIAGCCDCAQHRHTRRARHAVSLPCLVIPGVTAERHLRHSVLDAEPMPHSKSHSPKNSKALCVWLCVETEPRHSLTNIVRNQATSAPLMLHGCFMDAAFIRCAPQPAHEKFHPAEPSLPGFQAIVFATQHLDHLLWQALGLGKIGDRVPRTKTMYKNTVLTFKELMSSGVRSFRCDSCNRALQLIPLDKLDSWNI